MFTPSLSRMLVVTLAGIAWTTPIAHAQTTVYVDDVSDPNEDGSIEHPFDTIQEGIDAAATGWSVVVLDGTYSGTGNVWLDFQGKGITVRSQNGPEACVIDCNLETAVLFDEYEDADTVLEGFTITGALDAAIACGGFGNSSSPTINRCIFHGNGSGLLVNAGVPTVANCLFYENAIAVTTAWQALAAQFELINCTITDNTNYGVLHEADFADAWVYNCIIWGNTNDASSPKSHLYVSFSDIPGYGSFIGTNNIDDDPLFADAPPSGLYRLSCDSPCVHEGNAGYVHGDSDLVGMPRVIGSSVDMGASETTPCLPVNPSPSDAVGEVALEVTLSWSDGGGATSYDVYFGTTPTLSTEHYIRTQSGTSYSPPLLHDDTTYYWRIDSRIDSGRTCTGDLWRFTTGGGGPSSDVVIYVDASATGPENGETWSTAFTRLQDALHAVQDHAEIWVAAGTYTPDRDSANPNGNGDRTAAFELAHSVNLYGGFAGYETSLGQRDPDVNVTILSGDLAGDDGPDFANNGENSYHVVTCDTSWTGLDGFVVSGGNANGVSPNEAGGGMLIFNADPGAPVAVVDCRFIGNFAVNGGGVYNVNGSPFIADCVFTGNRADAYGGGLVITNGGSPSLTNCVFIANTANGQGGGLYNVYDGSPSFTNCVFIANTANSLGGGMLVDSGAVSVANCTIAGNAPSGIYNTVGTSSVVATNSILWGNNGSQIAGSATVAYSCVQGGYPGTGNIDADPLLLSIPDGELRLRWDSPCIDAGGNGLVPAGVTSDVTGNPRFVDDPDTSDTGSGTPPLVDMGAYEFQPVAPKWLYVDSGAPAGGDGLSWATAYQHLQDALIAARSDPAVIEVWVATGTYEPDREAANPGGTGSRSATFALIAGVAIRGGFAGNEDPVTFDLGDRDFAAHVSVLSGDLAGDDGPDFTNNDENSYHVVTDSSFGRAGTLDGFTVSGGNANDVSPNDDGGGLVITNGGSPSLTNCVFSANRANGDGGGVYNVNGSPFITNCVFSANRANGDGGGVYNVNGSPFITDCAFSANAASEGGGIYNVNGSPFITDCVFTGNRADAYGGGLVITNGGSPSLTNCVFIANTANGQGGGLYNVYDGSPSFTNCVFIANTANSLGGGMLIDSGAVSVANCTIAGNAPSGIYNTVGTSSVVATNSILWGNNGSQIAGSATVAYSCVQGGYPGTGNIDADPLFVDPDGPDNDPNTWEDNNHLLRGSSPCIDSADNTAVPADVLDLDKDGDPNEPLPFDLNGNARFVDQIGMPDTGNGTPPIVDMGAYEFQFGPCVPDADADDIQDDVDPFPSDFSSTFEDTSTTPTTRGALAQRGDHVLCASDAPGTDGVAVESLSGSASGALITSLCFGASPEASIRISAGDCVTVTCLSGPKANIRNSCLSGSTVDAGRAVPEDVDVDLFASSGGNVGTLVLPQFNEITFDPQTLEVSAPPSNTVPLTITRSTGSELDLAPGATEQLNEPIPTVTEWGMVAMTLLVLVFGSVLVSRRRVAVA